MDFSPHTDGRRGYLLLLFVFVLEAAASCPKPHGRENIVLTNEALLLNTFPEGVVVLFECANGYEKESGSGVTTCTGGSWTELDLICKKIDCGLPTPQEHMSFNLSRGTLFGALISISCDKGYQVYGSSFKRCYATGWRGRATCQLVKCASPENLSNGKTVWDSTDRPKYGEVIRFVCNEGYTLVGGDSSMCDEKGKYNPPPPVCEALTAEDITTTKIVATTTSPEPESPAMATKRAVAASATPTVKSAEGGTKDILSVVEEATTASVTTDSSDLQDSNMKTGIGSGYIYIILAVTCVLVVAGVIAIFISKFLLRRKGSYDTREDLKPELLQFQNL
ncbi:complement decay-accelerating factor isoform X2 [Echeneis naucrates]|uniref:Complement decay-accelerating factor-like n=1 Tax=Echeneis naucrates TaxID=173247 RepID=A0A665TC72_ECHNA|nr:complement decay-accelerating factor-like isoform X2 [Echeneis naucrates]